jgi:spermidine synthase
VSPRATEALTRVVAGLDLASRGDARGADLLSATAATSTNGALRQWAAVVIFDLGRRADLRGEAPGAMALYGAALSAWPGLQEAYLNLGRLLAAQGRRAEAASELLRATELNPDYGAAHRALARVLLEVGDVDGATRHAREAVRIGPGLADAHEALAMALAMTGRVEEALPEVREAVRLAPAWPQPMMRLALLLTLRPHATTDDVREAVRLARRATELTQRRDPVALETLAAAYAANGDFTDAVASEQQASELAAANGDGELAASAAATADLYRHGRLLPRGPFGTTEPAAR